ncbi:MAG: phosphatidate cytidylyltransferase [Planctomycetes bacterium]|nr:phosphatidate cytidylyltransferase [Planctomycetota bacterium]
MTKRLILGPLMILLLLGLLWLDEFLSTRAAPAWWPLWFTVKGNIAPGVVMFVTMLGLAVLAARELAAMLKAKGIVSSKRMMTGAAVLGLAVSYLTPATMSGPAAVSLTESVSALCLVAALVYFSRHKSTDGVIAGAGGVLLSLVYLGFMFGFVLAIRREHSAWVVLWVLAVTKSCDIGAYFTGKALGKHKLIPWLSPGKTWEGLAGGVALSAIVAIVGLSLLRDAGLNPGVRTIEAIVVGAIFGLVGQVGDLLESLLKRDAGTKDSGSSIPGFGGVLDVLDSPILVAPVAYWWLSGLPWHTGWNSGSHLGG